MYILLTEGLSVIQAGTRRKDATSTPTAPDASPGFGAVVSRVVRVIRCPAHIPARVLRMGRIWGRAVDVPEMSMSHVGKVRFAPLVIRGASVGADCFNFRRDIFVWSSLAQRGR